MFLGTYEDITKKQRQKCKLKLLDCLSLENEDVGGLQTDYFFHTSGKTYLIVQIPGVRRNDPEYLICSGNRVGSDIQELLYLFRFDS